MPLTAYPGILAGNGAPYMNLSRLWTDGDIFFVHNGRGSNNNDGRDPLRPRASIASALGTTSPRRVRANRGDLIVALEGHVETISASAGGVFDVAGVSVIGLGRGASKPQINFTTAVGADIDIDAASIYLENLLFTGGIDALTGPIDINAADCSIINCETRDVTGQATDWIVTDANADRLTILNHVHRGAAAAGADTWITIVGGDDIYIQPRWVDGNFAVACIENVTTAAVNLTFCGSAAQPCFMRTRNAADVIFTAVATTTGNVGPSIYARLQDNAANITEAFVGADMQFFGPIGIVNADGESAFRNADGSWISDIAASADL